MIAKELELDLVLIDQAKIKTNVEALESFIDARIREYDTESPRDKTEIRADRAELNKAVEKVARGRLDFQAKVLEPFLPISTALQRCEKKIKALAGKMDDAVKSIEQAEWLEKEAFIRGYWDAKAFPLATYADAARLVGDKWKNAGETKAKIKKQIDDFCDKVRTEIAAISAIGVSETELVDLQVEYLRSLDLGATLLAAKEKKEARERLAAAVVPTQETIAVEMQQADTEREIRDEVNDRRIASLAEAAAGDAVSQKCLEFCLVFKCTGSPAEAVAKRDALKKYLADSGIAYRQVMDGQVYNKEKTV